MHVDWKSLYRPPSAASAASGADTGMMVDIEEDDLHPTLDWRTDDMPEPQHFAAEELTGDDPMAWFRRLAADPTGRKGLSSTQSAPALREISTSHTKASHTLVDMLALELEAEEQGAEGTGFLLTLDEEDL